MRINPDTPILKFLANVFDTVLATLLFVLCSLPCITIGPALTALSATMMDIAGDECNGVIRTFFRHFRSNFRQSLVLGLILLAVGAIVVCDIWICFGFRHEPSLVVSAMKGITVACTALYFAWGSFLLPGVAQFQVTNRQAMRNAAVWMVKNPRFALAMVATKVFTAVACWAFWYICFPAICIVAYLDARICNRVFGVRQLPNKQMERKNQEVYYE